jgi:hypothetical protein
MGNTASFSSVHLAGLWAPLHGFLSWFVAAPAKSQLSEERYVQNKPGKSMAGIAKPAQQRPVLGAKPLTCFHASTHAAQGRAPSGLRVLREFEPGASPACAGRMVITGRMADVCAELERMSQSQRSH